MKTRTYQLLKRIRGKYQPGVFGKIVQKVLALGFHRRGFGYVKEREVQGVDFDAIGADDTRLAVEVKTTEKTQVTFGEKDHRGLQSRREDGYRPVLAVLRVSPWGEWMFTDPSQLSPGALPIRRLRSYRLSDLEEQVVPGFDNVLAEEIDAIMESGSHALAPRLKEIEREAVLE